MNKASLIERIATEADFTKKDAKKTLKVVINIITQELKAGNNVSISGFGVFLPKIRHARKGVNPQNPTESINIPEVKVAKFKAGKTLKDAMKSSM